MLASIKQLFAKYQIKPAKRLGQNFLIDKNILQKIIKAAGLSPQDIILEVGPGLGILTMELAQRVKKVIAIEKDPQMCRALKDILEKEKIKNVKIINDDILKINISNFQFPHYKVVANLPYYITSLVIRKLLEAKTPPQKMVLMVQKEVAQRIYSAPRAGRTPKMSILAVSIQYYAEPKIVSYVSKNSFWPKPKVDSAIIQITPWQKRRSLDSRVKRGNDKKNKRGNDKKNKRGNDNLQGEDDRKSFFANSQTNQKKLREQFFKIVKAGFSAPRKQLASNLAHGLKIDKSKIEKTLLECGLDPKQRAETLSTADWQKIVSSFTQNRV